MIASSFYYANYTESTAKTSHFLSIPKLFSSPIPHFVLQYIWGWSAMDGNGQFKTLLQRMIGRFFDVRIGKKMLIGYALVIVLPSALFISSYTWQMQNQLYADYRLNAQRSLQQSHTAFKEKLKLAEGYSSLFQNSKAVMDYLVGGFQTESEEIYAYLEEISPLISYIYAVNRDVKDISVFTYHRPLVPLRQKIIFVDESPEAIAQMPTEGEWHIDGPANTDTLRFNKPIYSFSYRRKEAYMSLDLRLIPMLAIFTAANPDAHLFLHHGGTYYALDGANLPNTTQSLEGEKAECLALLQSGALGAYLHNSLALDEIGASIVAMTPKSDISDMRQLYSTAILFVALFAVLSALYYLIIASISNRLTRFTRHLERVSLYSLREYSAPASNDEVGFLIRTYNDMIVRMQTLISDLNFAELKEKEAAFYALQAQIKPHFLFNALETLRMMAEEKNVIPLADMLYLLGNFIRYSMTSHPGGITLAHEIENVEQYLTLCKVRMADRLVYQICVEDRAKLLPCPSFILQPLVENCIYHAPKDPHSPLRITLTATHAPDGYHIALVDDGAGIAVDRLALIERVIANQISADLLPKKGNSIGLGNISERLRSFYHQKARFTIQSTPGIGTTCHIYIPNGGDIRP